MTEWAVALTGTDRPGNHYSRDPMVVPMPTKYLVVRGPFPTVLDAKVELLRYVGSPLPEGQAAYVYVACLGDAVALYRRRQRQRRKAAK